MDVVRTESVPATTLDNALESAGITQVDFLKLNTQGSELDILLGGTRTLDRVLGTEVEVEFLPLYRDQPLFADVHEFMQSRRFVLMEFSRTCSVADFRRADSSADLPLLRRALSRLTLRHRGAEQLLYADAVYLRDIEYLVEVAAKAGREADSAAARIIAVSCVVGCYDHALTFVHTIHESGIIDPELRRHLFRMVRTLGRSLPRLVEDARRVVARASRRVSLTAGQL